MCADSRRLSPIQFTQPGATQPDRRVESTRAVSIDYKETQNDRRNGGGDGGSGNPRNARCAARTCLSLNSPESRPWGRRHATLAAGASETAPPITVGRTRPVLDSRPLSCDHPRRAYDSVRRLTDADQFVSTTTNAEWLVYRQGRIEGGQWNGHAPVRGLVPPLPSPKAKFLLSLIGHMGWIFSDYVMVLCQKLHIQTYDWQKFCFQWPGSPSKTPVPSLTANVEGVLEPLPRVQAQTPLVRFVQGAHQWNLSLSSVDVAVKECTRPSISFI